MRVYYVNTSAHGHHEGRTSVGPYTDRAEAERCATRLAEQGFLIKGQGRQAFETVNIVAREVEADQC